MRKPLAVCFYVNTVVVTLLCLYVFFVPAGLLVRDLRDPGLRGDTIPGCAFRWHRSLSPKYETWARRRVASGAAAGLTTANISGTQWPLFGSVFYLWATEALQEAAQEDPSVWRVPPSVYARGAIEAAAALVIDPNHAGWVKQHWGQGYLEEANLFYRMLLISALTSYQKLLGDTQYEELLREQVESLAAELDGSPHGVIDDYPGQCYPVDIVAAVAAIARADAVLGTDHSDFVARAVRGFQDTRLDTNTGLPAYRVNSVTGRAQDSARGVGLSFMLIWAPEIWPETARLWYEKYVSQFWQQGALLAGFREYPKGIDIGWFNMTDVDAGPVVAGYGAAACAFGIGATRAMGDAGRACRLGGQSLVACWPLPNGTLLLPRALSNMSDAPYLGEAAMLFALTRRSRAPIRGGTAQGLPGIVYIAIPLLVAFAVFEIAVTARRLRRWQRADPRWYVPAPAVQFRAWVLLVVSATICWFAVGAVLGLVLLLTALVLPLQRKRARRADAPGPEEAAAAGRGETS